MLHTAIAVHDNRLAGARGAPAGRVVLAGLGAGEISLFSARIVVYLALGALERPSGARALGTPFDAALSSVAASDTFARR